MSVRFYSAVRQDVPAPDVMTNAQHMPWMLDEYETITNGRYPAMLLKTGRNGRLLGAERLPDTALSTYLKPAARNEYSD